ncbi:GH3 auxin-responsive promoter family protein [Scytonema sp. NUACC26]|uniref:GH3 family domain-containing protein n=1 Tax=Scytonema sp. NUACC26 TaxID=3140176 RepID=UPI0034DC10F3
MLVYVIYSLAHKAMAVATSLLVNYSGFYRYDIGDVMEVLGFYEQTPLIVFRYRQGGLLSAINKKTTEFHVTQ